MKSFRILLLALLSLTVFVSCDDTKEKDLEDVDLAQLLVSFKTPDLDNLWGPDWKDEWQYTWNETAPEFGTIGYTKPDLIKGTIYNVDRYTGRRYSSFFKIFDSNGGRVSLTAGSVYDMLFYNFPEKALFRASDDFEEYTALTPPNGYDSLGVYNQAPEPRELLGVMLTGVDFSNAPSDYEKETDADGNVCYIRNIDVELNPYSIIYLIQVVIMNNNDVITGARDITVSGLAPGVDLFTRKTFNKTIFISTEDVKPLQNHKNVRLEDGTVVENAEILAARMLTWGLPDINPMMFSKVDTKVPEQESNYMAVDLMLRDGRRYTKVLNITEQMYNKPAGGVITVCVDVNDIALLIE